VTETGDRPAPARGRVQTVLGPVDPGDLGWVLPHEHTAIALWHIPNRWDYWELRRDPVVIQEELAAFRAAGGGTVVDLTVDGVGRDPVLDLAHEVVRQRIDRPPIDVEGRRVVSVAIPTRAHHQMHAGRASEAHEPGRVAAHPGRRHVDEGPAAGRAIARELGGDDGLVRRQLPVVPAVRDVPQRDLGVLVRQREPELGRVDRAEDRLDVCHGGSLAR